MRKIYLQSSSGLSSLKEETFEKELVLQDLLEKYPQLIPSDEIIGNPSFLMVARELPVSVGFLDLLYIDQSMVPTIIETKVNNPEIRRKIIGQGYEYLTSISYEFTGKMIIDAAKAYLKDTYASEVKARLDLDKLNEKEIDRNLKKPRLRLIFAADFIPRELRKFVEFINNASRGIDVYAVQVERFQLDDNKLISVSTFGPSEMVVHDKSVSFGLLSREEFINKVNQSADLDTQQKQLAISRIEQILNIAEEQEMLIDWGTKCFKISYKNKDGELVKLMEVYNYGVVYIVFQPTEKRTLETDNLYRQLDQAIDLKKSYLDNKSQYKAGKKNLFRLTDGEFTTLTKALKNLVYSH